MTRDILDNMKEVKIDSIEKAKDALVSRFKDDPLFSGVYTDERGLVLMVKAISPEITEIQQKGINGYSVAVEIGSIIAS